jgi:hypothetical protein
LPATISETLFVLFAKIAVQPSLFEFLLGTVVAELVVATVSSHLSQLASALILLYAMTRIQIFGGKMGDVG